jgi:1,4-dihydroxy-2-naphthoyl-CoA synthase
MNAPAEADEVRHFPDVKGLEPCDYQSIVTEIDLGVGIITLNRPERHNAFDER